MGEIPGAGIAARQARFRADAGQGRGVDGDRGKLVPGQPVGDDDGGDRAAPADLGQQRRNGGVGHRDQVTQPGDDGGRVARFLAGDGGAVIRLVTGQQHAVAVVDQPPRRRQKPQLDRVAVRQQPEFIGPVQLHGLQPPSQCRHHGGLDGAQHQPAPGDRAGGIDDLAGGFLHSSQTSSNSPGAARRSPSARVTATTTG